MASVSIARSRSKSCRKTERGSSESDPFANPPAGECGGKDQVRRALRILKEMEGSERACGVLVNFLKNFSN